MRLKHALAAALGDAFCYAVLIHDRYTTVSDETHPSDGTIYSGRSVCMSRRCSKTGIIKKSV